MRGKLRDMLTAKRTLVVVVGLLLALAWAVPSVGAGVGKVARLALGRANQAFYNSNLAINTSDKARTTANQANSTAGAANNAANAANAAANSAQSTASQALSLANSSAQVVDNFTNSTLDPDAVSGGSCDDYPLPRAVVLPTDQVIVTPPSTQDPDIIVQAFTSTGSVTLRFCNISSGLVNPVPASYEFSILR